MRFVERIQRIPRLWIRIIGIFTVLSIGVLDTVSGAAVSFALLYLLPIVLVSWFDGKAFGFLLSAMSVACWTYGDVIFAPMRPVVFELWNGTSRLVLFAVIVWMLDSIRTAQAERLQVAIDRYTRIVESAIEGMIILDAHGNMQYVNTRAAGLLGYPRTTLEGQPIMDLVYGEASRSTLASVLHRQTDGGKPSEIAFLKSDNTHLWTLISVASANPLQQLGSGKALLLIDISERKKSEEELRKRYDHISAIQQLSDVLQASLDLKDRLGNALRTVLQATGFEVGWVYLLDESRQTLRLDAHLGFSEEFVRYVIDRPSDRGVSGNVLATGKPFFSSDVAGDPLFDQQVQRLEQVRAFACIPLLSDDQPLGVLNCALRRPFQFSESQRLMLLTFGKQIGVAIHNAMLYEATRTREERIRQLSIDLVRVQEAERRRFARELHDGLTQLLTTLKINAELALESHREDLDAAEKRMQEVVALSDEAQTEAKQIANDLRPSILDDFGLRAALSWQASNLERRTGLAVDLHLLTADQRFDSVIESTVYRIVQELLANVVRHAEATRVTIQLLTRDDVLALTVADNGKGFELREQSSESRDGSHHGIRNMRERVRSLGGTFRIESSPGNGTEIMVELPEQSTNLALKQQVAS